MADVYIFAFCSPFVKPIRRPLVYNAVVQLRVPVVVTFLIAFLTEGAVAQSIPRTPDGHPDLSGNWLHNFATPFQRPTYVNDRVRFFDSTLTASNVQKPTQPCHIKQLAHAPSLPPTLPIDAHLPGILARLQTAPNLVLEAEPGAGKTTRVPPAFLTFPGDVLVLEPRRIAARMAARRVSLELGEQLGQTVGYQVRFEEVAGPRTRLRFLTEGVLTRRVAQDPTLRNVSTVVLDEFHERHLETDLALALLRRLQLTTRPDLRIIVMSATLDAEPVREFLGGCQSVQIPGRLFPLEIRHTPYSAAPLEQQVKDAVESAITAPGDILVFLPGAAEIRRASEACAETARRNNLLIAPLYGDLSPEEQDRAVEPAPRRKLILSTNIAESSLTIEGVRIVIDSGLARIAGDSPWTGLPTLETGRISQASATQRAGRAARTAPGLVIRLYTAEDFRRRPDHDSPEIVRRELSQMCLQLEAAGIHNLDWLTPPPEAALTAAETLLDRLDARGANATRLARLPLHPRLSRLVLEGGEPAARLAALLSSGQRLRSADVFHAIDEPLEPRTRQVYAQLKPLAKRGHISDNELAHAVLAAFPDRVGRRRPNGVVLLANGKSARLEKATFEFLVAVDLGGGSGELVRLACPIEPEWLLDKATDRNEVEWNREAQRVESVKALVYDQLVIDETRGGQIDDEAAARVLAAKVIEAGIARFVPEDDLNLFLSRVEFAGLPRPDPEQALRDLCFGLRSFADVRKAAVGFLPILEQQVGRAKLDQLAPARLRLPSGRNTVVHYETGKPPWVASRLQDFFGLTETPRIGRDQTPLVVHLLAPNQRPVQTTTDLSGFWQRLYPQLRKELGRRYPRHAWPENPT